MLKEKREVAKGPEGLMLKEKREVAKGPEGLLLKKILKLTPTTASGSPPPREAQIFLHKSLPLGRW